MILSGNVTTKMRTRNLMRNFSNHLQETLLFLIILMSLSETIPNRSKRGLPENPITNCSYLRKFLRNNKIIKQMLPLQVDDTNRNISNTTSITHDQINNMAITKRPNLTVNTRDCQKQKRVVFCHTYINNMYGFYTTVSKSLQFVLLNVKREHSRAGYLHLRQYQLFLRSPRLFFVLTCQSNATNAFVAK